MSNLIFCPTVNKGLFAVNINPVLAAFYMAREKIGINSVTNLMKYKAKTYS